MFMLLTRLFLSSISSPSQRIEIQFIGLGPYLIREASMEALKLKQMHLKKSYWPVTLQDPRLASLPLMP